MEKWFVIAMLLRIQMNKLFLFLFLFSFSCCSERDSECSSNQFLNITNYKVLPNQVTKSGFKVDTSGLYVDLEKLDERLLKIEKCLQEVYEEFPSITLEQNVTWKCMRLNFSSIDVLPKNCLIIKVVEPIIPNPICKIDGEQFIRGCEKCGPAYADERGCYEKGMKVSKECPCCWRTAIQDDWVIITPPKMNLWDVVRMATSCNGFWTSKPCPFVRCALL